MHRNENILLKFTQLQGKIPYSESKTGQLQVNEAGSEAALKKKQTEIHYWNKAEQELFSLAQTWNITERIHREILFPLPREASQRHQPLQMFS